MSLKLKKSHLLKTKELLQDNSKWTVSTPWRPLDTDDLELDEYTPGIPCQYCLGGALALAVTGDPFELYNKEYANLFEQFAELAGLPRKTLMFADEFEYFEPAECIYSFNDSHSYEEVMEALDRAIERADDD